MKKRLFLFGLLILVGIGFYGYRWVTSAASTSATITPAQPVNDVLASETSLKSWQTDYYTTMVPSWLHQVSSRDSASDPVAGSYVVSGGRAKDAQVAVTIASLGNNSLQEIPAVRLRHGRSDEYRPTTVSVAPAGAIAFSRVGSIETSVFWQYHDRYIAVVTSGSSSEQADLRAALDAIIANWHWLE